ncbi:MAG TPA: sulfite exporter TauE/SafE family protein [Ilumatobacteraceae bacterium]|nr:sulfite exporter TauE/SafE family protein [Ilumatobacteraceae bacterium]
MSTTELVIVLVAVVIGAIAKAVTGMGLPLIAIPIASLFVDVDTAIVVIAFPNVLANLTLAARERHSYPETRDLPVLAVSGIIGAVLGTLVLVSVPETPLVVAVIVAIVGYIVLFFAHPELRTTPARSKRLAPLVGGVAGIFQGAVGISGPIVGSWIHSYRLGRSAHILSVTSLFFITGSAQLVVLIGSGELAGRVPATLLACIPVFASIPIGTRLRTSISVRGFDLAIVGMLGVSAIALLVQTFA